MTVKIFYTGDKELDPTIFADPETKLIEELENVEEIIDMKNGRVMLIGGNSTTKDIKYSFKSIEYSFKLEVTA